MPFQLDKQSVKYLGHTFQLFVTLLLATLLGWFLDEKFWNIHLLVWALPCLVIVASLILIIQSQFKK